MTRIPHVQFLLKGIVEQPSLYGERHELIDPTLYMQRYTNQLNKVKGRMQVKQRMQQQVLLARGTIPIVYEPGDGCYVENPLTTHRTGMPTLDRRYDGPYEVMSREGKTKYRIDFRTDFPLRHSIINVDKMVPYVNRATGEAIFNRTPHPYLTCWNRMKLLPGGRKTTKAIETTSCRATTGGVGANPVHRAQVPQQQIHKCHSKQIQRRMVSKRICTWVQSWCEFQGHRVRETVEDVHNGDGD